MKNLITAVLGALLAAQASLMAKWPTDAQGWTMFALTTLIGLFGALVGKGINGAIDNARSKP